MTPQVDCFLIVRDEEELLQYCLESFGSIVDLVGLVSVVDNGSTDATMDILDSFRTRLPLRVVRDVADSHHGRLRSRALKPLTAPWIYYLDADETHTGDMRDWLASDEKERADQWEHYKYTTIVDRLHYVEGGNGGCYRLFRNLPGVGFSQNVHTEARASGMRSGRPMANGPLLFDHTACKSVEALWSKGYRYQAHWGTVGIGPPHEYVGRVENAHRLGLVREFPDDIKRRIFTSGP